MPNPTDKQKPLPTLWTVPDALWDVIQSVLAVYDPPKKTGRARIDARKAFDGILFRLRTGCQWNHLPKAFGDDSSVHRTFQRWEEKGVFDILWAILLTHCQDLGGVDWHWQAADGCLGKARGVAKQAGDPDNARAAKKGPSRSVSVPTPPTVVSRASRKACWSKAAGDR
jgi:putative transposase